MLGEMQPTQAEAIKRKARAFAPKPGIPRANGEFGRRAWDIASPAQIVEAQRLLVRLGFSAGAADGKLNARTAEAIRQFERENDLPVTGDKLLIGGAGRGSDYRTVLTGAPTVLASAGVGFASPPVIEVTFNKDACQLTWPYLNANPGAESCRQNGATWAAAGAGTDWASVAGIRVTIDFDPARPLSMGKSLDVSFATRNLVASTPATALSSVVPIGQQEAWNQFGIQWKFQNGIYSQRIPSVVGVTPIAGPLEIRKVVDGPAKDFAPASFDFQVACSIAQPGAATPTVLTLPNGGKVTVSGENGVYTPARIDGIPVGAVCSVVETANGGATSTTLVPTSGSVTITNPALEDRSVPTTQVVNATNTFGNGSLVLTKKVTGEGAAFGTGPFDFQVTCMFQNKPVTLANGGKVSLPTDGSWTTTLTNIPVGAKCSAVETNNGGATSTTIDPADGVTIGASAEDIAGLTVTNDFELGGLTIMKGLEGGGAEEYGTGPFVFTTTCTFQNKPVTLANAGIVSLPVEGEAMSWSATIDGIPVGAQCIVEETGTGSATESELLPADGKVTIPRAGNGDLPVTALVAATNTFDIGGLTVTKIVEGEGVEEYGAGPFILQTECTWQKDGQPFILTLPGDGEVSFPLDEAEDPWSITYTDLIVGAECVVEEIDDGGATTTALSPTDGTVTIPAVSEGQPQVASVSVTNTFDVGKFAVQKVVDGQFELTDIELADLTFSVRWVASNGEEGLFELNADNDWAAASKQLPIGATVTLTEIDMPSLLPYVGFAGYVWLPGEGIEVSEDGTTATVEIGSDIVQLQMENTFELLTGTFEVSKQVTGPEANALVPGFEFTVAYTYAGMPTPGLLKVTNGATVASPEIPAGTTVTISEVGPQGGISTGGTWESPVFVLADGTRVTGSVTVTIGDGQTVRLLLDNPTVSPPPDQLPPIPSPPVPPVPPITVPPFPQPLPQTGSGIAGMLTIGGLILLAGAVLFGSARRRRVSRI